MYPCNYTNLHTDGQSAIGKWYLKPISLKSRDCNLRVRLPKTVLEIHCLINQPL